MANKLLEATTVVFFIFASFAALSSLGIAAAPAQYHAAAEIYPQGSGSGLDADKLDGNETTKNAAATTGIPIIDAAVTYANLRAGYATSAGGVAWAGISGIPAGFADNVDNVGGGIAVESDPTVAASVKDGVSWGEVSGRPAFNGCSGANLALKTLDLNTGAATCETDDVGGGGGIGGSGSTNYISKWTGSSSVGNSIIYETTSPGPMIGISKTNPSYPLDVNGGIQGTYILGSSGVCIKGDCRTSWDTLQSVTNRGSSTDKTITVTTSGEAIVGNGGSTGVKGGSVSGNGIIGTSVSGTGVWGSSNTGSAILGQSSGAAGVYGQSSGGNGVVGIDSGWGSGVYGQSQYANAIYGLTSSTMAGVIGHNLGSGTGVKGVSSSGSGVYGTSSSNWGVFCDAPKCGGIKAWSVSSDERLKNNITTIENALAKAKALRGVTFEWKNNNKTDIGFVAQEVKDVVPEVVSQDSSNGYYAMETSQLTALLVEAIKEQQKQIDAQQGEIKQLKEEVAALKSR